MLFKNELVYTEKDFIAFMKVAAEKNSRMKMMNTLSFFMAKAASAIMLLGAAFNIKFMYENGAWPLQTVLITAVMVVAGFAISLFPIQDQPGKQAWNKYGGQGMRITYTFDENKLTETRQSQNFFHGYDKLTDIREDEEHIYLFISAASAFILRKDAFKAGNAADFLTFIRDKMPEPVVIEEEDDEDLEDDDLDDLDDEE